MQLKNDNNFLVKRNKKKLMNSINNVKVSYHKIKILMFVEKLLKLSVSKPKKLVCLCLCYFLKFRLQVSFVF